MPEDKKRPLWRSIAGPILGVALVALIGYLLTDTRGDWYNGLHLPAFQPSDAWFFIAWSFAYACAAMAGVWIALHLHACCRRDDGTWLMLVLLGMLHILWSLVFFTLRGTGVAVFVVLLLLICCAGLIRRAYRLYRWPALLLIPDLLLCGFTLVLNYAIAMMN